MLDQVLDLFAVQPAFDLNLMQEAQTLAELTARVVTSVGSVIRDVQPDVVVVQGDTTTTFAGALAAFYEDMSRLPTSRPGTAPATGTSRIRRRSTGVWSPSWPISISPPIGDA